TTSADSSANANTPGGSTARDQSGQAASNGSRTGGQRNRSGGQNTVSQNGIQRFFDRPSAEGDGGGGGGGPITGSDYAQWTDRLRDVEEMLDFPDLRTEVARVRDRVRAYRTEYRKAGEKPSWANVRLEVAGPLVEVRARIAEELARRQSSETPVPADRDPVPAKFAELVRRYYEKLGKSE
ncbi:MAG TPA: hypothetical protein VLU94_02390, partial [Candidatus Nitrosotalea sp.]|nr:hypothetical protein [Candidatus Nitrosotalea sp.]